MKIKILKKLDPDNFQENSPAWHGILDLSYFDNDKLIPLSIVASTHGITESEALHNLSELLAQEMITLVD